MLFRSLEQRGEQIAARLHGVVERYALACEQQREVKVIGGERLGAEALGVGGGLACARLVALIEGDDVKASPPASSGTPNVQVSRIHRARRWLAREWAERRGGFIPSVTSTRYHPCSGSSRPWMPTTICARKPSSPAVP